MKILFLTALLMSFTLPGEASAPGAGIPVHSGVILPSPQTALYGGYIEVAAPGRVRMNIITGDSAPELDRISADRISRAAAALSAEKWSSIPVLPESRMGETAEPVSVILVLGSENTNALAARIIEENNYELPENPEGYIIRHFESGSKTFILAAGASRRGTYYAAQSIIQLLKPGEDSLLLRKASVYDYPAYRLRVSGNDESIPPGGAPLEAVEWLSMFKLNGWAAGQSYLWPDDWRNMPEDRMDGLKRAADFASEGAIDIMLQVHPFGRAGDEDLEYTINIHRYGEIDRLEDIVAGALGAGVKNILIRADDFHELSPLDREHFLSKAHAHSFLLNEIHRRIRSRYPEAGIFFCPPYYTGNEIIASADKRDYFKAVSASIPEDIVILWTGPEVCSFAISGLDAGRFASFARRPIMLWDNTVFRSRSDFGYEYEYAFYLFNPLETAYPPNFHDLAEGIRYNYGYDGTEISRIANITLADFLWNPAGYSPSSSLENAVAAVAGREAAGPILKFSRKMHNAYDLYHSPARILSLGRPEAPERYMELLDEIREKTSNKKLASELEARFQWQEENISAVRKLYLEFNGVRENSLAEIDFSSRAARPYSSGKWSITRGDGVAGFSFPFETPSRPGARGSLLRSIRLPASGTGKYYLVFISDDDYNARRTSRLWSGYLSRQVLVNGKTVWERDIADDRELALQAVDITDIAAGAKRIDVMLRGYDKKGVYNLGARMAFSTVLLTESPPYDLNNTGRE